MKRLAIFGTVLSSLSFVATVVASFMAVWSTGQVQTNLGNTTAVLFFLTIVLAAGTGLTWGAYGDSKEKKR